MDVWRGMLADVRKSVTVRRGLEANFQRIADADAENNASLERKWIFAVEGNEGYNYIARAAPKRFAEVLTAKRLVG